MNDIHDINLNLLVILERILRLGSVTAAAGQLHLTQSAVSHALRKLRVLFQDPLFIQQGHKLEPTALALDLYPRVQRFVADAQELVFEPPQFDPQSSAREFHISAVDYLDILLLPKVFQRLRTHSPLSNLRVHRPTINDMNQVLAADPSFVTVGRAAKPSNEIMEKNLWPESYLMATALHHPLAQKDKISLSDYTSYHHALIGTGEQDRSIVDEVLETQGKSRRTALVVPSFLSIPLMVSQSDLIVTAPFHCLKTLAQHFPLKLYEPPIKLPGFTMKLFWSRRYDREPAQKFLRQQILAAAQEIRAAQDF